MTQDPSRSSSWFAVLCLLPTGILVVPATLAGDPLPHAAATGWALLFALPAAAALPFVLRGGLPRCALWFLPLLVLASAALLGGSATDTFELRRSTLLLLLSAVFFLAGTAFSEHAKVLFGRGAVLISLALSLQGLLGRLAEGELGAAGPLGNTGVLSQAALPGAVLGAWSATSGPPAFRVLGGLAAFAFALHAGTTPVLAGILAFALALVLAAAIAPRERRRARWRAAAFAAIAPLALFASLLLPSGAETSLAGEPRSATEEALAVTGGSSVRLRVWSRIPGLVADFPLGGVGPGQFRARFPPYRDPLEIELSTHGRRAGAGVEVEHAHSDWLQLFAEYGLPGGLAFTALTLLVALTSWRGLRRTDGHGPAHAALCATSIALLVNAALHAPLSFEPAPALLAWVVFGALLGSGASLGERLRLGHWTGALLAVLAFASVPQAVALCRHGALLARRQVAAAEYSRSLPAGLPAEVVNADFWLEEGRILRDALEAAPDSVLALSLSAAHFRSWSPTPSTRDQAREAWERVLELRPHQVSALIGLGALAEEPDVRRAFWEQALEVDPGHPVALQNLTRLELLEGDPDRARAHLDSLERSGQVDPALLRELGSRALLAGRTSAGISLLARLDPAFAERSPAELFALSQEEERLSGDSLYASALACAAHRLWGLEHLEAGDASFAIAKFRQALRVTRRYLAAGDAATRLMLAASLQLADRGAEAAMELSEPAVTGALPADWHELPELARGALAALGYRAPDRAGP